MYFVTERHLQPTYSFINYAEVIYVVFNEGNELVTLQ